MKKLLFLFSIFTIVLSCSSDETSTPVTPPAPIAKYTITLSAGEGGIVSTTGGEYEAGQTVSVTATPQGEYVFTSWSDGNTNATRTITIGSNSTLTANFEKRKYPLTINFEGEGEVLEEIVNAGRTTDYDSGTTVKLTAQAAAEWVFVGWTGDIESTEESVQIVIGEPKEVTAKFEKKKYPLTVNIEGEGEVIEEIIDAGRTTDYDSGTTVKLTAQPADEWLFTGWSGDIGDIDPTENPIQLNIIESKTVTATFEKKKYPLTVNIEGEGEVLEEIVNAGRTTDYDSGTTVKLTVQPADEWLFTGWSGDIGDIDPAENPIQLSIIESKTVTATFVSVYNPKIGDFYHNGIIVNVEPIPQGYVYHSNNPAINNYIIEIMSLNEYPDVNLDFIITNTDSINHIYRIPNGNKNLWLSISDNLEVNGGERLDKTKPYLFTFGYGNDRFVGQKSYFGYSFTSGVNFSEYPQQTLNTRFSKTEFVLNGEYDFPVVNDFYPDFKLFTDLFISPAKVFEVDEINKKIKIFRPSHFFGYISYNSLNNLLGSFEFDVEGNSFDIPTQSELEKINSEFYLKGFLNFGNNVTYYKQEVGENKAIHFFNFYRQQYSELNSDYSNLISSPLVVSQITFKLLSERK